MMNLINLGKLDLSTGTTLCHKTKNIMSSKRIARFVCVDLIIKVKQLMVLLVVRQKKRLISRKIHPNRSSVMSPIPFNVTGV